METRDLHEEEGSTKDSAMRWLQRNQGHLLVVERARQENNAKRFHVPERRVLIAGTIIFLFSLWIVSVALNFARTQLTQSAPSPEVEENHDHDDILQQSPLLKGLKRHRVGSCYFRANEQPQHGFIASPCSLKRNCGFRDNLEEARDACLNSNTCMGITFVPWEDRYELRDGSTILESFDGQHSSLKYCDK